MPSLPHADLSSPEPSRSAGTARSFAVRIDARAHMGTLREVTAVLQRRCPAPLNFLGEVNGRLSLTVTFADPGMDAAESLARRLIGVDGVRSVEASLTDPARGERYAVRLIDTKG